MFNNELREMELDPGLRARGVRRIRLRGGGHRLVARLRCRQSAPDAAPQFVEHLTTITLGVIGGTAEMLGIKMDPDRPLQDVMPHSSAAS